MMSPRPTPAPASTAGLAVGLAVAVLVLSGSAAPVSATAGSQSYPVPASGAYMLTGHGFGHGRGMSQYGAYGAAARGVGYRAILRHYYPGTSTAVAGGRLRVLVTSDTTPDLVVSPAPGLRVHDLGSGATYRLPVVPGATRWRLGVEADRTVLDYRTSRWHRYAAGGRPALVGDGQLDADGPLTLWTPSGSSAYRGGLRAASPPPGTVTRDARDTVNVVSLEDYLRAVVPAEMPPSWSLEAVKAQAVAARTYAVWSRDQRSRRSWQICDTVSCQVYRGVAGEHPRADVAVARTARQVLTYGGRAAFTQFSASNGGWSAAGSRPYLVARPDPYDDHPANPVHSWSTRLSASRVTRAFPRLGRLQRLVVTRRDGHGRWGGRVLTIVLDGSRRDVTLSGDRFRWVFSLRSTWFSAGRTARRG
jgi:SpoIID/LytB domain protein